MFVRWLWHFGRWTALCERLFLIKCAYEELSIRRDVFDQHLTVTINCKLPGQIAVDLVTAYESLHSGLRAVSFKTEFMIKGQGHIQPYVNCVRNTKNITHNIVFKFNAKGWMSMVFGNPFNFDGYLHVRTTAARIVIQAKSLLKPINEWLQDSNIWWKKSILNVQKVFFVYKLE